MRRVGLSREARTAVPFQQERITAALCATCKNRVQEVSIAYSEDLWFPSNNALLSILHKDYFRGMPLGFFVFLKIAETSFGINAKSVRKLSVVGHDIHISF